MKKLLLIYLIFTCINTLAQVHKGLSYKDLKGVEKNIYSRLGKYPAMFSEWTTQSEKRVRLERVACSEGRVNLYFNDAIAQISIREELCKKWEKMVRDTLGTPYADAKIGIFNGAIPIERYIPNIYRVNIARDPKRSAKPSNTTPLIKPIGDINYGKGLLDRHIAVMPSHGFYYDQEKSRWQFQRPALFGTIEDLHTYYLCNEYLIPMLENAGAIVITPRERDTNQNIIIIDNDISSAGAYVTFSDGWTSANGGYKHFGNITDQNPFTEGSYMKSSNEGGAVTYTASVASPGEYAVYVSYKPLDINAVKALYAVYYSGGVSKFEVNQKIGGGWLYLGKFPFDTTAKITLTSTGPITADAVRIGGGMGSIVREGASSGVPRWAEGARYYMQFDGLPDNIYRQEHDNKSESDYMDDYKSRGDWVTYLKNARHIPIDLSVALHTNAGIVDSIFGTLMINFTNKGSRTYTDGSSAFAGRDLSDIIQTQIVEDIRAIHDPKWVRRSLYDKSYAEISRPDCPAVIIEMFSHQNQNDMKIALTPSFRFTMARAIYKGILKFLADRYRTTYQVQPLPISSLKTDYSTGELRMNWQPTIDSLEQTATPDYYKIYTALQNRAFDHGLRVEKPTVKIELTPDGLIRRYKITAINGGGESFSSPIIAACIFPDSDPITLQIPSQTSDYAIVGRQTDFDPLSPFIDNDSPGWGASDLSLLFKGLPDTSSHQIKALLKQYTDQKQSFIIIT